MRQVRHILRWLTGTFVAEEAAQAVESSDGRPVGLPVMELQEMVVLPHMMLTLPIEGGEHAAALSAAFSEERRIFLVPRREGAGDELPLAERLFDVGVIAEVEPPGRLPDGSEGIIARAVVRAELGGPVQLEPYPRFTFTERPDPAETTAEIDELAVRTHAVVDAVLELLPGVPREVRNFVRSIDHPGHLADNTGYSPDYTDKERLELLAAFDIPDRLRKVLAVYEKRLAILEAQQKIQGDVQDGAARRQREFFLRQQMEAIRKELGEEDETTGVLNEYRKKIEAANLPEEAHKAAIDELARLERVPQASPEYGMIRTYLDWLVQIPWDVTTGQRIEVAQARAILEEDHYGMKQVKERLLEYLAVRKRKEEQATLGTDPGVSGSRSKEPILVFVGPPGVGKTSLGQSIARAMGRRFVRISLGGVRDEAELRGFRRTYVGSAPGRIVQAIKTAGAIDAVFMLDELDKVGSDWRGDPAAALLEILDPEQNHTFRDHYLEVPLDLSRVLFIATANTVETIHPALRDRMEIITLSGYSEHDKMHIARRHLVPRQRAYHGLTEADVNVSDAALQRIISDYTREAGVRGLERELATVMRKVTKSLTDGVVPPVDVQPGDLKSHLGRPRHHAESKERIDHPGIATGMVWTPVGGDIVFVEAVALPSVAATLEHHPELRLTGQLGDVMRESAQAALTAVRARAGELGISPRFFAENDLHVHVPGGAVPKDGPSAGITIAVALASVATGRPVRDNVAMTGELTLRGRILPIGGLKEKVLGAHRAGMTTIVFPQRNEGDLDDLPQDVRDAMQFLPVSTLDEGLAATLMPLPGPCTSENGAGDEAKAALGLSAGTTVAARGEGWWVGRLREMSNS